MPTPANNRDASADTVVVSSRVFPAERSHVAEAFRDPEQLANWWGPAGFSNTIREFDLRPGGRWRITMRSSDGQEFENESEFVIVEADRKIVFRHLEPVHAFVMTMLFEDAGPGTRLTWRMDFDSAAELARVKEFIVPANEQNFDRLGEWLQKTK